MRPPKPSSPRAEARRHARAEAKEARKSNSPPTASVTAPVAPSIRASLSVRHPLTRYDFLICLVLLVLILGVYWPVSHFQFLSYDDYEYVSQNVRVAAGLSAENIAWAFRTFFFVNWHPLTWLSYMLDSQLFGVNSAAFHLVNLLFHSLTTLLVFFVFNRMTGARWPSAFLAMLFAVHPLHVESVAWVAERKDVLSGLFWMLTLWAYARYAEKPLPARYGLTLLLFALGLMAKPMLVTLPFVLLLLDFWPLRRWPGTRNSELGTQNFPNSRLILEKVPFFILAAVSSVVTCLAQREAQVPFTKLALPERLANALISYARYVGKAIWPGNLAVYYPHPGHWPAWEVAGAVVLLLAGTLWSLSQRRKRPYLVIGWLWFLGTLVPVIGVIQVGGQSMADRYMYLPLIGLLLMFVWGAADLATLSFPLRLPHLVFPTLSRPLTERRSAEDEVGRTKCEGQSAEDEVQRTKEGGPSAQDEMQKTKWRGDTRNSELGSVCATIIILACLAVSSRQVRYWSNNHRLFEHVLAVTTGNALAEESLGVALLLEGQTNQALVHIRAALEIDPGTFSAYGSLGNVLLGEGKTAEAKAQIEKGLQLNPDNPTLNHNFGLCLALQGKFAEALPHYSAALRVKPEFPDASFNFANALSELGRLDEAVVQYAAVLRFEPDFAAAHLNLGNVLNHQGRYAEAAPHYLATLRAQPTNSEAHANLALALARQGDREGAFSHFIEALRLDPANAESHYQFASALYAARRAGDAVTHYREALRLRPDFVPALNDLAWILAANEDDKLRDGAEAVKLAERACDLTGRQQSVFVGTLAGAYAEAGQYPKAIAAAQKALELAQSSGQSELAESHQRLLDLYRAGKPYRDGIR